MFVIEDIHLFAFPFNLALGIISVLIACTRIRKVNSADYTIAIFILFSVIIGFSRREAVVNITRSWAMVLFMFWLLITLAATMVNALGKIVRNREIQVFDIANILVHGGLWLALLAGYFGNCDKYVSKIAIDRTNFTNEAAINSKTPHTLPFYLKLNEFRVDYYDNDEPSGFVAEVAVADSPNSAEAAIEKISVNHPLNYKGYDIYLSGYDTKTGSKSSYCILQMVKDPWKSATVAGIILILVGMAGYLPRKNRSIT